MKKYSLETTVGIFVVIGLLCIGYMTIKLGKIRMFGGDYYTLYAHFSSVSGIRVDSPVEINGIEVGRVEQLNIDQDKQIAMVKLRIGKGIKIYEDAIASIKTSGLNIHAFHFERFEQIFVHRAQVNADLSKVAEEALTGSTHITSMWKGVDRLILKFL